MFKKWSLKQMISLLLSVLLVVCLLPNKIAIAQDTSLGEEFYNEELQLFEEQQTDEELSLIEQQINEEETVLLENSDEELSLETNIEFEEGVYENTDSEEVSESIEIEEAKVTLNLNHTTNKMVLESIETDIEGNEIVKEYLIEVETATEEEIIATFTDTETGEVYNVNTNEINASFIWFAIPIGIVIGEVLLSHLIAAGLAIVISGVAYLAVSEFLKRPKTKNHYTAIRQSSGLFIGNGLTHAKAVSRLKSGGDTWSTSQSNAQSVAKTASPISKALGPEIDKYGSGKLYHYHPISGYNQGVSVRMAAHAFYGSPRN